MSRSSAAQQKRCVCGHPRIAHYGTNVYTGPTSLLATPCHATIYETVPNGMNAYPCRCTRFTPATDGLWPSPDSDSASQGSRPGGHG